jgi:acyl-[acyl-carrier-protein]-phospholipid O-acyltransferase/long-chain-fatty-acid--[acyl-carrier-protein] ligase
LIGAKLAGILAACMSVGIAVGCLLAGKLCRGRADFRLVRFGAWMMVVCLFLLGMPAIGAIGNAAGTHLLGFYGSIPVLIALGMAAGMFAVPLQVVIQTHPPQGQKGRMIAALNICTWLSILISGVLYGGAAKAIAATELPEASVFFFSILFILPVALLCRTDQS